MSMVFSAFCTKTFRFFVGIQKKKPSGSKRIPDGSIVISRSAFHGDPDADGIAVAGEICPAILADDDLFVPVAQQIDVHLTVNTCLHVLPAVVAVAHDNCRAALSMVIFFIIVPHSWFISWNF